MAKAALAALLAATTAAAMHAQAPTAIRPTVRIGEGEAQEFAFSRITGLAVDAQGYLYVADGVEHRVDVFDRHGVHVGRIGRRGRGPGEFQYPTSIAVHPNGEVWIRDSDRLQRFARVTPQGPATRFVTVVTSLGMYDWTSQRTGVIDADGRFHAGKSYMHRGPPVVSYQPVMRIDAEGQARDSLMPPQYPDQPEPYARVQLSATDGRILRGLNAPPFTPVRVWVSTPRGTIISGDARTFVLRETDVNDREVRRFTRDYVPVPVDPAERRDSLRALSARLDSIPVPLTQVQGMSADVRARRLPTTYPAYRELAVSANGVLWVRRWSDASTRGRSVFDVFAADARYLGAVVVEADLRADPTLVVNGEVGVGIEVDPETGMETLVRFQVPVAFRGETARPSRP